MGINKYNNSCIYKIWKDNFIYIGSTCNFKKRMYQHKSICNNINSQRHHLKIYQTIRLHGGWDEFEKEIIKHVCCENKKELYEIEGMFIKNIGTMNYVIPGRSQKQYALDNKQHLYKKRRENIEINKDKIAEQQKKYNEIYREKNKEKIKESNKIYREKNKKKINEKIICSCCGILVGKKHYARHKKSKKCLKFQ